MLSAGVAAASILYWLLANRIFSAIRACILFCEWAIVPIITAREKRISLLSIVCLLNIRSFLLGLFISMISRKINSFPEFFAGPIFSFTGPERIICRQAKGQQSNRAQIQTACSNIVFGHCWLTTYYTHIEPSFRIKCVGSFHGAVDNQRQCAANLCRR